MDPTGPDIKDELLEAQIKQELDDLIADVPYVQESSYEDFDNDDDSDSDYEWQSSSRPKRTPLTRRRNIIKKELSENCDDNEANDAKSRLPCQGCQRTFLSKANLNKHIGQNGKCKRFYENQGILPPELIAHEKRKSQLKEINAPSDTLETQYECEKCKKKFTSEGGVNRHVSKIKACKRFYDKLNGLDHTVTDGLTARQSYYVRNRDRVIQKQREYYARNADRVRVRRVQHYRNRQLATAFEAGDFELKRGSPSSGYLLRHKDYYEKNKEVIKERRRSYYHLKKEALTQKVGKNEFARISATKNLAELPDPFEAYGKVEIDNLKNEAIEKRNSMKSNPGDKIDVIEFEDEPNANDEVTEKLSPLGPCQYHQKARFGNLRKIQL